MKRLAVVAAVVFAVALGFVASPANAGGGFNKGNCTFNGKKLYGRIQEVTIFPDVKVKVVPSLADVKVKKVTGFANTCGRWQMVTSFADTRVQFVTIFPDVTIEYVNPSPGAN